MNQQKLTSLARQGDCRAIAQLVPFWLVSQEVIADVSLSEGRLEISLYALCNIDKTLAVRQIQQNLLRLAPPQVRRLHIQLQSSDERCLWQETVELIPSPSPIASQPADLSQNGAFPGEVPAETPQAKTPPPRPARPQKDLGLLFLERVDLFKIGFLALLATHIPLRASEYTVRGFLRGGDRVMVFLHNVNLIFHEAGHVFWAIFGQFIGVLGGSLMQILIPTMMLGNFLFTKQWYAAAIALWWVGQNFMDVSIYIKDAGEQILPLLGGEAVIHDWFYLLGRLKLLQQDDLVGNFAYGIGLGLCLLALLAGAYFSQTFSESHFDN
ncbi:MAG: hypothetical protein HC890_14125 [Chloroflexaceae bacterium]|nr:hypothetical protein [Chloroflexaceae bacterium]